MTCIVANVGKDELMLLFSVICAYCAKEFGSVVKRNVCLFPPVRLKRDYLYDPAGLTVSILC